MDIGQIMTFLRGLGCQKISVGSQWVRSTCPMEHLHAKGKDNVPSFAVSIHPGDTSFCRCQACGVAGGLELLVWRLEADGRPPRPDLFEFLTVHNQVNIDKLDPEESPPPQHDIAARVRAAKEYVPGPQRVSRFVSPDDEPQAEVQESVLKQMIEDMPPHILDYLTRTAAPAFGITGRGLARSTVQEWELGWHPIQQRICIPIRDENGKLVAVSGRRFSDDDSKGPKYLHSRFKRDRVLFGEHRHVASIRKGYLFEGFFQTIYTWQFGYVNVLARMGTHLSQQQATKVIKWFDHLVIVPDGDKPGMDAAERDARTLKDWVVSENGIDYKIAQVDIAPMPRGKDADTLIPDVLRTVLGPTNTA